MIRREYKLYIEDILLAMDKIERYTKGFSYVSFMKDEMVVDAVVRNLQIIGEATRNIPEDVKGRSSHIPWQRMTGLRNIIVHEYFGVDLTMIWEIITENLPDTKPAIQEMLKKEL